MGASAKSIKDLDSVLEAMEDSTFLDDIDDGLALENYYNYVPWGDDFQIPFHKDTRKIRASFAGNRCGKTTCGVMETFISMTGHIPDGMKDSFPPEKIAPPNSIAWICCKSKAMIESIFLPKIAEMIPLKSFNIEYQNTKMIFNLPENKRIEFKTYESGFKSVMGSSVFMVHLDEEPDDKKFYTECLTRTLDCQGYLFFTMTPLQGFSWVYHDIYQRGMKTGDIGIFRADMYQAPHLDDKDIDLILGECPSYERESRCRGDFTVSTERHVFDSEKVHEWVSQLYPPEIKAIGVSGNITNTIEDLNIDLDIHDIIYSDYKMADGVITEINPEGYWEIWEDPQPNIGYVIGVDTSSGQGEQLDHTVAHVKTITSAGTVRHVATLRTNCIAPYEIGRLVCWCALYYNNALIAPENENYGEALMSAFQWYPFVYESTVYEYRKSGSRQKKGFTTKGNTRNTIIENENDLIKNQNYPICNEKESLLEMKLFHFDEKGRPDHPSGGHSDGVIASAIADYILVKHGVMIKDNARQRRIDASVNKPFYRYPEDDPAYGRKAVNTLGMNLRRKARRR